MKVLASDRHSTHTSKMATKLPYIRQVSIAPTNGVDDVDDVVSNGCSATPESTTSSRYFNDESIPKPNGEPGHPGRGGYNLKQAVKWKPKHFDHLKVLVFLSSMYFIIGCAFRNVCIN